MTPTALFSIAGFILLFGGLSARLERTPITPPILFVGFGMLMCPSVFGIMDVDRQSAIVHMIAQITLIFILFSDASRIDCRLLSRNYSLPMRMLAIGMPLTIGAGTLVAAAFFPGFAWLELALLAAILTPTDAALGQVVVSSKKLPIRIRQGLNVESGLNDGIALPAILILAALAGSESTSTENHNWTVFVISQLVLGPLAGIAAAWIGGKILTYSHAKGWINHAFEQLAGISIALLAYSGAELVHGNGFIAAFAAGFVLGNTARPVCQCLYEFTEAEGQLLALLAFMFFGATVVPGVMDALSWTTVLYVLLSLTVVRMLPILLSLIGTGLKFPTKLFLGWFGPRGLATILFGLLILDEAQVPHGKEIFLVAMTTALFSIVLHGLSALPLSKLYASYIKRREQENPAMPELQDAPNIRLRLPAVQSMEANNA